jgi:hypothetical protein
MRKTPRKGVLSHKILGFCAFLFYHKYQLNEPNERMWLERKAMANKQAHIVKTSSGWKSTVVGNNRASFVASTQRKAYELQRNSFKKSGGGEISIHRSNGRIRDKNTIAPMRDYCPPRG